VMLGPAQDAETAIRRAITVQAAPPPD
jgi:hypothetical protein